MFMCEFGHFRVNNLPKSVSLLASLGRTGHKQLNCPIISYYKTVSCIYLEKCKPTEEI